MLSRLLKNIEQLAPSVSLRLKEKYSREGYGYRLPGTPGTWIDTRPLRCAGQNTWQVYYTMIVITLHAARGIECVAAHSVAQWGRW